MSDLIYRQKAIEALDKDVMGGLNYKSILSRLPSAEPDIVMCKDCKHYGYILHSGTQFEYGECFGHEESDYTFEVKPDDFCSRAERRTNA